MPRLHLDPRRRARSLSRPQVEPMEARLLLATITVTGPGDTIAVDQVVTLREAITAANTNAASGDAPAGDAGLDTIAFNIPGAGVQTITLAGALPAITEPATIDGYTQPGASPNTNGPGLGDDAALRIQIVPTQPQVGSSGLVVAGGGSTIRGLVINGFTNGVDLRTNGGNTIAGNFIGTTPDGSAVGSPGTAIAVLLQSSSNTIGGTAPADRNVLSADRNLRSGVVHSIHVPLNPVADASNNVIQGNFLGTDATGTKSLDVTAVILIESGSGDQIGGTAPGAGNLISGGLARGIRIVLGGPIAGQILNSNGGHVIQGNLIGTDVTGTVPAFVGGARNPNRGGEGRQNRGIDIHNRFDQPLTPIIDPRPITIGGSEAGAANVISGNFDLGIGIQHAAGFDFPTFIQNNRIGTDRAGTIDVGNGVGISLIGQDVRNATITGNTIAFNQVIGVSVPGGETGNLIVDNSIHTNGSGEQGISRRSSTGPAAPSLTSATVSDITTTVLGTVGGAAGSTIRVDLYTNAPPPQRVTVQGQTPVQTLQVAIGANGTGAFTASFPTVASQPLITATATTPSNTTSPFSAPAQAPAGPLADLAVTTTAAPNPATAGGTLTYTIVATNAGPDTATGVTVIDSLPTGVTFVSATGGVTPVGNALTFNLGNLGSGASATVTVVVSPTIAGSITNSASVTSVESDPNAANNADDVTTAVNAAPVASADLSVSVADSPDPVAAGNALTYTITVTNAGPDTATGVTLTGSLPAGATFVSATGGVTPTGNTLAFNLGTLALGAGATIMVVVRPNAAGTITGSASVTPIAGDPNTANNSATAETTLASAPPPPSNKAPTAIADAYATTEGVALSIRARGVLRNDTDPEKRTLGALMVTRPSHGTLSLKRDGSFRYTPAAGFSGRDRFSYRASDGSLTSAPVSVTLTVTARQLTPDTTGPRLKGLQRFGFHSQPTQLVLTFDQLLTPASATDLTSFRLVAAGQDGRLGTRDDVPIAIRSATYDPASRAVTLTPSRLLPLRWQYELSVRGGGRGLTDLARNGLDGGDAVIRFDRGALAGPSAIVPVRNLPILAIPGGGAPGRFANLSRRAK